MFAHKNGDFGALFVNGAKLPRSNLEKAIVTYRIGFCATLLARVNEQVFILARSFFLCRNDVDKSSGLQKRKTSDYTSTSVASVPIAEIQLLFPMKVQPIEDVLKGKSL